RFARPRLLAEDGLHRHAAGAEVGHSGYRQQLHRPVQGHHAGADHLHVRPARRGEAEHFGRSDLGDAADGQDRLHLCGRDFLDVLFRHVALFTVYGASARYRPPQITRQSAPGDLRMSTENAVAAEEIQVDRSKMQVSTTDVAVEIAAMHKWYGEFHVLRDIN